jgi:hypothetical protein
MQMRSGTLAIAAPLEKLENLGRIEGDEVVDPLGNGVQRRRSLSELHQGGRCCRSDQRERRSLDDPARASRKECRHWCAEASCVYSGNI